MLFSKNSAFCLVLLNWFLSSDKSGIRFLKIAQYNVTELKVNNRFCNSGQIDHPMRRVSSTWSWRGQKVFCVYYLCTIPPKSIKKFRCTISVYVCQAPEFCTVHPDGSIFTFCHANSMYFAV